MASGASHGHMLASSLVGVSVSITTSTGDVVEGEIYCYDPVTDTIALQQKAAHTTLKSAFHLIRTQHVKAMEVLALGSGDALPRSLPPVRMEDVEALEAEALRAEAERRLHLGVGVTKEAQQLYDAINKTMPCAWDGRAIVVLSVVYIHEPYVADSCELVEGGDERTLARVKRVVSAIRSKLRL
eukprot:PLAT2000.1.p1 GENE.PLAT2000.1~~PLAT2000.1.p1  ORF type:complete len:203 (+),score=44.39 PLAT2000.1:58-609(+)